MKKKIALVLSISMAFGLLGCEKKDASNSEKTTIKWIFAGPGEQKDSRLVWEAVNEKIKTYSGMENVDLDIEVIPSSDYAQKFLLMQTSEEQLDVVQTYTLDYAKEVRNKSFLSLDDYVKKSEGLKDAFPEWVWGYANVDGHKYFVPNYQMLIHNDFALTTQKELSDKYWDAKKAEEIMWGEETFTDTCWDVIEDYLDVLNKNGKLQLGYKPLDSLTFTLQKGFDVINGSRFYIRLSDPEHKVVYMDEIPERINSFKRLSQLYKKGYIRSDIASLGSSDNAYGSKDGYTLWHSGGAVNEDLNKSSILSNNKHCGFECATVRTKDYDYIPPYNAAGGTAIASSSKNPDKAFRLIELMNTEEGKEVYNLLVRGIEGKHYTKISDNVIAPIDYIGQASSTSNYGLYAWVVGNTKYGFALDTDIITPDRIDEVNDSKTAKVAPLTGFVADLSSLTTEVAQINTVFEEYKALNLGTYSDVDKTYKEYMDKVKTAGLEKVREEIQKQVDEFFSKK